MKITCIMCPVGCELNIEKIDGQIKVSGNGCIRGARYGEQEMVAPKRMITSLIKTEKGVASVKTTDLVDKNKIFEVLKELENFYAKKVRVGEIVIKNVAGTNADIVVTRTPI